MEHCYTLVAVGYCVGYQNALLYCTLNPFCGSTCTKKEVVPVVWLMIVLYHSCTIGTLSTVCVSTICHCYHSVVYWFCGQQLWRHLEDGSARSCKLNCSKCKDRMIHNMQGFTTVMLYQTQQFSKSPTYLSIHWPFYNVTIVSLWVYTLTLCEYMYISGHWWHLQTVGTVQQYSLLTSHAEAGMLWWWLYVHALCFIGMYAVLCIIKKINIGCGLVYTSQYCVIVQFS